MRNKIQIKGFDDTEKSISTILILNSDELLIGGWTLNSEPVNEVLEMQKSFIMKLNRYNEWDLIDLGDGELKQLIKEGNFIYAFKIIKSGVGVVSSSELVRSINGGKSWSSIKTFPFQLTNIVFGDSINGYLAGLDNFRKWVVYQTKDGGSNWVKVIEEEMPEYKKIFSDNTGSFILKYEKNNFTFLRHISDSLIKRSINFKAKDRFFIFETVKINGSIIIAGHFENDNRTILYNYDISKNVLTEVSIYNDKYSTDALFYYDGILSMIVSSIEGIGTDSKVVISDDYGKTWKTVKEPLGFYFQPYSFYKNSLIGYTGVGYLRSVKW